jgi:uncharacterized OB-fold protein
MPHITEDDAPFWEAALRHELLLQRCLDCGTFYEPPVEGCWSCHKPVPRIEWARVSGRGVVHTFNVYHRAYHPWFADRVPYNTAIIELEEGPLLRSQIVGCRNDEIKIGMPVEVVFEDIDERVSLPTFRPAGA